MELIIEAHSGELTILILTAMVLATLLIVLPQILRTQHRQRELLHEEHMKSLEKGHPLPPADETSRAAGRTAALVPIVVICAAGTVSCFLVSSKSENVFSVSLAVWCVAGVVSLAAITGGVALMGRVAQLNAGAEEEDPEAQQENRVVRDQDSWRERPGA